MDNLYEHNACTPTEAFKRIAEQAKHGTEYLQAVRIAIESRPENLLRFVNVWSKVAPDAAGGISDNPSFLVGEDRLPANAVGLESGLARVLLSLPGKARGAAEANGESMFLMRHPDLNRVTEILRLLEHYGPPRASPACTVRMEKPSACSTSGTISRADPESPG